MRMLCTLFAVALSVVLSTSAEAAAIQSYGASMADCNGNGIDDAIDLAECGGGGDNKERANLLFGALDNVESGDAWCSDCNVNTILDVCDINSGTSDDCNGNGIPDECETASVNGLLGEYYRSLSGDGSFSQLIGTRVDPVVDFEWGWDSGPFGVKDNFAVRWTGWLRTPATTGTYRFFVRVDDAARLYVGNTRVINRWPRWGPPTEFEGSIGLEGSTSYFIKLEYYEAGGEAVIQLKWQPPGGTKEIIPTNRLTYAPDANGNGVLDECEDCNANGIPDMQDLVECPADNTEPLNFLFGALDNAEPTAAWCDDCNGNFFLDVCDISGGTSSDVDGNGIPDECQEDCNGNGVPDDYDLATCGNKGTTGVRAAFEYLLGFLGIGSTAAADAWCSDCNANGVIDVCDISGGQSADANGNGIPDECEMDCNGNGIPDYQDALDCPPIGGDNTEQTEAWCSDCNDNGYLDICDIGSGTSDDCNANGVPDECDMIVPGVWGDYYRSEGGDGNFSVLLGSRVDPQIAFNWGWGSGPFGVNDHFTVRWTGSVRTTAAGGSYTFHIRTDDGARLWVNNTLLIDAWYNQPPTDYSASITLAAKTTYPLKVEYYESGGGAEIRLSWTPPGGSKVTIPTSALSVSVDLNHNGVLDACEDCNGNGIPDEQDLADCGGDNSEPLNFLFGALDNVEPGDAWCRDCNLNGVLDVCDIDGPTSEDLNGNGVPDECDECVQDSDCDDGVFCNGAETCVDAVCVPGTPPSCDDSIACTQDECDTDLDECAHRPDDGACSDGLECTDDVCDTGSGCSNPPLAAGTPCGNATPEGSCDNADACDGTGACDPKYKPSSTECRPAASACDAAENCPGNGPSCPTDAFLPASTVCRPATGDCDVAENCPGNGPTCPTDGFLPTSTVCRPAAGDCDAAEKCPGNGPSCPANGFLPASTVCRAAAGECDVEENCPGNAAACPADAVITECISYDGCCPENCTPEEDTDCGVAPIPTVSEWGLVILGLLLLTAGKVYFGRREELAR